MKVMCTNNEMTSTKITLLANAIGMLCLGLCNSVIKAAEFENQKCIKNPTISNVSKDTAST